MIRWIGSKIHYLGFVLSIWIAWQTFTTSSDSAEQLKTTFATQARIGDYKAMSMSLQRSLFVCSSALILRQPEVFKQASEDFARTTNEFLENADVFEANALNDIVSLSAKLTEMSIAFQAGTIPSKKEVKGLINQGELIRVSLAEREDEILKENNAAQVQWFEFQDQEGWMQKFSRLLVSFLLMFLTWTAIQREKAEKVIRASESLYKLLFASLAEGVVLCLKDGTITFANESLGRFLKKNSAKMVGHKFRDYYPVILKQDGSFYDFNESPIEVACRSQNPVENMVMGLEQENESIKWFSANAQPVFDSEINEAVSTVISLTDITSTIHSQEVIASQQEQILQTSKMAALGEMAGGVAHEINNPLAIIQTKSDELEELAEDEGQVEGEDAKMLATSISKTVKRISKIVKGLKTFSREGSADPFELVSLSELVEETLEYTKPKLVQNGLDVQVEELPKDVYISCRATQIEQVLVNLLHNARDAVQVFDEKWVKVGFEREDEVVRITVTDCGHGIPKDVADKLFQPFFTTKAVGKGTGLGMSISKGIIDNHKGQLYIDDKRPNTCFVIELPAYSKDEDVGVVPKEESAA